MCNNIGANKVILKREGVEKSYDIASHTFWDRDISKRNEMATALKTVQDSKILYKKGHPLKLGDSSRVYEIHSNSLGNGYKEYVIIYSYQKKSKKEITQILRYKTDTLKEVEEFLLRAFSVYELRNIDLRFME